MFKQIKNKIKGKLRDKFKNKVYIKSFTIEELNEFANIWKKNGKLLRRLEDSVSYKSIIETCKTEREREVIEKVVKEQNDILEGFYKQRVNKNR